MDDVEQGACSDSAYSASETAQSSSSAQKAFSNSAETPKKRKIKEDLTARHSRLKRLKSFCNDDYLRLSNETVTDVASEETPKRTNLPESQIGATLWSPEEKGILFCSLARRGRHGIQDIAADIGSKSESEVFVYLERLQMAANEQVYAPNKKLPKAFDIPAAFEISQKCCASLDAAAESLSVLQQQEEERIEKRKHGTFSLLTPKIAQWAERRWTDGGDGDSEASEMLPAAKILHLETFLALSKRFFMNSSIMENNWRTYIERRRSPTITYTAFSDFHNLAISVTKRIVQSSLFFAMSRQRALDASSNHTSGRHVKKADVIAALNVLGMDTDTKAFWAAVARKCKLRVYEKVRHRQASGKRYSYDEIEAILNSVPSKARGRSRPTSRDSVNLSISQEQDMSDNVPSDPSDDCESSGSLPMGNEESENLSDRALSSNAIDDKRAKKQELHEKAQDTYAEAIDQRASRAEERRLWELLGEDSAERMASEDVELPKMPMARHKDKEDLDDWNTWVNYAGEWEVFNTPVPVTNFIENRSLRRRIRTAAGLADSDTHSENVRDHVSSNPRSSRRSSSRRKPLSEEFVHDESSSEDQSSGTEDKDFEVRDDETNTSRDPNKWRDAMGDELDEPEEQPQHPSFAQEMSSDGESHEKESTMVDEGHRTSGSLLPIADNRDIENSEDTVGTNE